MEQGKGLVALCQMCAFETNLKPVIGFILDEQCSRCATKSNVAFLREETNES